MSHSQEAKLETAKEYCLRDQHNLTPSRLCYETDSYTTKSFLVRYCEEEVEIEETVLFRAEINVGGDYENTEFYLDFDLYFGDLASIGGAENWKQAENIAQVAKFKKMQTQSFVVKQLPKSIFEFCPVTFKGSCYSVLSIQIMSLLIDYKFRPGILPKF